MNAAQWETFADRFTEEHDGWKASLHLRENDGAVEIAVDDQPFRGVTFEHRGDHEALVLTFGDKRYEQLAYVVDEPCDLAVLDAEAGECLLIIGLADGTGCVLELADPLGAN